MTAGLQYEHTNTLNGFQRFGTGWYVFDSWDAVANQQNPRMYAITASTTPGYAQRYPSFDFNQFTAYLQDEFTVSDRFSLTAGVRLDLPTYPSSPEVMTHPMIAQLEFLGEDFQRGHHYDTGVMPKARVMFSPRVGFNYDIMGDQSLIMRGGTGIFTGRIPFVWIVAQSGDAGMLQLTQNWRGADVPGPFNPDRLHYLPETPVQPGTTIPTGGFTVMDPDFKMPQAWKTSLALDARLPWGMKGTVEGIYNKNINEVYIFKDGLEAPTALNIDGYPDHRKMYPYDQGKRYQYMLNSSGMPITTAIPNRTYGALAQVVTNAPLKWGGYYASVTAKIEKPLDHGFAGMVAYTRSWARNFTDGNSDQAYSVWSNRPTVSGGNSKEMGYASYVMPHNVVASFSYSIEYAKSMATTVSLLYNGGTGGRFNYLYTGNIVNDGGGANLIYIPKDASEIDFVDYTYREGNQDIVPKGWTAQEQEDAFFAYIEQDKYLRSRKGQYAERGAALRPWESRFDVKIGQDFYVKTRSGKRNTLQLSLDIINAANLLNSRWGVGNVINLANQYGEVQLLRLTNAQAVANGARPAFTLNPLVGTSGKNAVMPTSTFRDSFSYGDTFSFQIGIRYLFN
jgi:hypothetical protein